MKYIVEESLSSFNAWSGVKDTKDELTEEQLSQVEDVIEELYPDNNPPTDTDINDILWFERDAIAQYLGFSDWEPLNHDDDEDEDEDEQEEE